MIANEVKQYYFLISNKHIPFLTMPYVIKCVGHFLLEKDYDSKICE